MTQMEAYRRAVRERDEIIRANAGRRIRGLTPVAVPLKPARALVPIAYTPEGDYVGRLNGADECPDGCIVRIEATP